MIKSIYPSPSNILTEAPLTEMRIKRAPPVTTRGPEFRPPSGFCRYIWALASALAPSGKARGRSSFLPRQKIMFLAEVIAL